MFPSKCPDKDVRSLAYIYLTNSVSISTILPYSISLSNIAFDIYTSITLI